MTNSVSNLTIADALAQARRCLGAEGEMDAAVLLAHVLQRNRAYLHTWPERVLTADERIAFEALIARRAAGEPVAYLTGRREFWSLELAVTPATLIPRADTETLVAEALKRIPRDARWRIVDLGTGSGAIALAIAHERPACRVTATDLSPSALEVAAENARRLGIGNVELKLGRWCAALSDERFHLIASNPPYIAPADPHLQQGDLRFEPSSALVAEDEGLADLREIVAGAPRHLESGGWLLLEHGHDQGATVRALLAREHYHEIETVLDLENRDRVTLGRR